MNARGFLRQCIPFTVERKPQRLSAVYADEPCADRRLRTAVPDSDLNYHTIILSDEMQNGSFLCAMRLPSADEGLLPVRGQKTAYF